MRLKTRDRIVDSVRDEFLRERQVVLADNRCIGAQLGSVFAAPKSLPLMLAQARQLKES